MDRIVLIVLVVLFTAIAAFGDLRTKKLPNMLVVPALLAALAYHAICGALESGLAGLGSGLLFSMAGFGIGFGVLFVLWIIGGGGGGDVKYMGALGAWLGPQLTLQVLAVSAVFAVVGGSVVLLWQFIRVGRARTKKRFLTKTDGRPARGGGDPKEEALQRTARRRLMPFAVPAALATWCVLIVSEFVSKT